MDNTTQNMEHLLSQISVIVKKYEEIAEITGENFNVFKVLGLTTNEVRTHSAFLAELLNPKGSHGCKDAFLKLFIEQINIDGFNTENAIVQVEKHIGLINSDYTEGGYIDIIVTNTENRAIIIENKIYAGDQFKQLCRYQNYGEKSLKSFNLIYLTLDRKEPSDESKGTLKKEDYLCISYGDDIIAWLEKCQKEAVSKPMIRETIQQYIHLIKRLTNQTTNNKMSQEIVEQILKNENNFDTYVELNKANTFDKLFEDVFLKHTLPSIRKVLDIVSKKHQDLETDFEIEFNNKFNSKKKGLQFNININRLTELNLKITFMFQADNYDKFSFGYSTIDKEKAKNYEFEYKEISNKFNQQYKDVKFNYGTHICFSFFVDYINWMKFTVIKSMYFEQKAIQSDEKLKTKFEIDFKEKVDFLLNILSEK